MAKQKAVFQTGSQQRSDALFRRAVELVRNGVLGKIQAIEVGLPPGYDRPQGDSTITDPPEHLDYDLWCGPSEKLPYMRARHHRWWRGHRAYGGGVLMDWIGHHNDIAHWALDLDTSGPSKVEAVNWTFPEGEVYNTPHHYEIRCDYAGGIRSSISSRHALGTKFLGENGWVFVTRGALKASDPRWVQSDFQPGEKQVDLYDDHMQNFLECVKTRKPCIAPAESGHRSITPGHLGYVSQALGRALNWDPEQELVIDDDEANRLLAQHGYRKPWNLAEAK
jgi:predicted dehydrogenase